MRNGTVRADRQFVSRYHGVEDRDRDEDNQRYPKAIAHKGAL